MHKRVFPVSIVILGLILIAGFFLRAVSFSQTSVINPYRADARDYITYAYNIRHHHIYSKDMTPLLDPSHRPTPDAIRSPGYPLFLSLFTNTSPDGRILKNILFCQMLISTLTLFIAFLFFKNFLPKYLAQTAALLTALSPHLIVANSYVLTETLYCFFLVLTAWLMVFLVKRPSKKMSLVVGLALGIATLIRPGLQYFPLFAAALLIFHFGRKRGLQFTTTLLLGFLLVILPWFVRNLITLHTISDKTLQINFLHHGMYPNFMYKNIAKSYGFPYRYDPRSSDISKSTSSVLIEIANRFRRAPIEHLKWFLIKKPEFFWSWNIVQGQGDAFVYPVSRTPYFSNLFFKWTHRLMFLLHWPLVLIGTFGTLIVWMPGLKDKYCEKSLLIARFASSLLIYATLIHIIGAPFPRYSIPLRPFLYGMAMFAIFFFFNLATKPKVGSNGVLN